jgi:Glycosyl transferases group 1
MTDAVLADDGTGAGLAVAAETWYPPMTAGSRVRVLNMREPLAAHGIHLAYLPTLTNSEYRVVASSAPSAVKALTLGRAAGRLLRRRDPAASLRFVYRLRFPVRLPGAEPLAKIDVYDFDDALPVGSISPANARFGWLKRESQHSILYLRRARLVLAGSPYLADLASQHAARVEVVPSCVEPAAQPMRAHGDVDVLTIGWIGSPSTTPYLESVLPIFGRLAATGLSHRLVAIGADTTFAAPWFSAPAWSLASEPGALAEFDLGIMPMPDDPWTRGKCGYKVLQYFAAGVPVVASPVGLTRSLVGPDRGRLVAGEAEWIDAIRELASDTATRRELGANGRRFAEQNYSYDRWAPEVARLLRTLAAGR